MYFVMPMLLQLSALTPGPSLLTCEVSSGPSLTGCRLKSSEVASAKGYDASYALQYLYECQGTPIDIALFTESQTVVLRRSRSPLVATVSGREAASVALIDAGQAWRAQVLAGCSFQILGVTTAPSRETLASWQKEASYLTEGLTDSRASYNLASHIEEIVRWDDEQLQGLRPSIMAKIESYLAEQGADVVDCVGSDGRIKTAALPREWGNALDAHPEMVDYVVVLDFIDYAANSRPSINSALLVSASAGRLRQPLVNYYRVKLEERISRARRLLTLFAEVKHDAEGRLAEALRDAQLALEEISNESEEMP